MDQWIAFAQDKWVLILIVIVVVFLIGKLVKTVIKWAIIVLLIAGLLFYGANYKEAILDISGKVMSYAKDEIYETMQIETNQATYTDHGDGTFTVQSPNFTVTGKENDDRVQITYRGQTIELSRNGIIDTFIEQSKQTKPEQ